MNQLQLIILPFSVARDLGWLRTYQALEPLSDRVKNGGTVSTKEKQDALATAEIVASNVLRGLTKEEIADFLNEWVTDPLSRKSCPTAVQWEEVKNILSKNSK